ncbi:MAG: hypothetical protein IPP29_20750 [Bacteroidetes bacterium]|nr:hypothetical protein [Bacteroidota bacterium]
MKRRITVIYGTIWHHQPNVKRPNLWRVYGNGYRRQRLYHRKCTYTVTEPLPITFTAAACANVSCFGGNDNPGHIVTNVLGGLAFMRIGGIPYRPRPQLAADLTAGVDE